MIKKNFKGKEGNVESYAFRFLGKSWIVAISETKWHAGEKYKRAPIWVSTIKRGIPALFIWKIAIGFDNRKPIKDKDAEYAKDLLVEKKEEK